MLRAKYPKIAFVNFDCTRIRESSDLARGARSGIIVLIIEALGTPLPNYEITIHL